MTRTFLCEGDDWMTYYVKGSYAGKNSRCCEWVVKRLVNLWIQNDDRKGSAIRKPASWRLTGWCVAERTPSALEK